MDDFAEHRQPEEPSALEEPSAASDDVVIAEAHQLLGEIEADLAAIEEALSSLERGNYGTCEVCSGPIEPTQLAAEPGTRRCAAHRHDAASDVA